MTHILYPKVKRYVVYTSLRINRSQHAFGFLGTFNGLNCAFNETVGLGELGGMMWCA